MKTLLQKGVIILTLLLLTINIYGQTPPPLGVAADFALFTTNGAVTNVGISQITGNVGTNSGASTGFGNINGQMHDQDGVTASAAFDLNIAYNNLGSQAATMFPGILLGNGQILVPAVYSIAGVTTLNGILTLDGLGDPNACFVIQLGAAFSSNPGSSINLINGTKACNVFWKIDGATNLAAGTTFKGTIVCAGAIGLTSGDNLEGRALSTTGAITVSNVTVSTPIGCGSPYLTGPIPPNIGSLACYGLLTADGALTNTGVTMIIGDIGTNNGPVSGFNPGNVTGMIHAVPDASTAQGSADMNVLYTYLNGLTCDIELLYPVQFGNSQVLTPHVYCMLSAAMFTDTIFLDAQGNANAIFVIKINGALTTSTYSNVVLIGGTQSSNVFWLVEGSVDINDYSTFRGTLLANNGAISMFVGSTLDGRALSTTGAITTNNVNIEINSATPTVTPNGFVSICEGDSVILTASSGTAYQWSTGAITQSITVDTTGNYWVIINSACGSMDTSATTTVTMNFIDRTIFLVAICQGDSVLISGIYQSNPGIYSDTLINMAGCDSIISTDLMVNPLDTNNVSTAICDGDSIFLAGQYRYMAGLYSDTLSNVNGCDSIIATTLTVNPLDTNNVSTAICDGDSIFLAGQYRYMAGLYSDTLSNVNGCDSIIATTLTVNSLDSNNVSTAICDGDSIFLAGQYRYTSGLYSDTLSNVNGCDSIIATTLTVNPVSMTNAVAAICDGDSIFLAGQYRNVSGLYSDTLSNTTGCDSIIATTLTVHPVSITNAVADICTGDSIFLAGAYRSTSGTYADTLSTINGCDSIFSTVLTVNTSQTYNASATICNGDSLYLAGAFQTMAGSYSDTIPSTQGCDSILVTTLFVNPVYSTNVTAEICDGSSIFLGGSMQTTSGVYVDVLTSTTGCDSTIVTVLTVQPLPGAFTGPNFSLSLGNSASIGTIAVAGNTFVWTPATGLSSSTSSMPLASPTVTTTYSLTETDPATGCSETNSITITVIQEYEFFNGFSPNGDGTNDYWNIPMLGFYTSNMVTIINRWGSEVWKASNYNNIDVKWTGQNMNNVDLPDGTYFYIINYNDTEKRGWVFIKR
jgi:gliding motility-associated-like protein